MRVDIIRGEKSITLGGELNDFHIMQNIDQHGSRQTIQLDMKEFKS